MTPPVNFLQRSRYKEKKEKYVINIKSGKSYQFVTLHNVHYEKLLKLFGEGLDQGDQTNIIR